MADFRIENAFEKRVFKADNGQSEFIIPYIITPKVSILEDEVLPTPTEQSKQDLSDYFLNLGVSELHKSGASIIFGTYDNLHLGHKVMLQVAKALGDELYVGIEDQEKALIRKNNKHPILPNEERLEAVRDFNITDSNNVFVRENALISIMELEQSGINIETLVVGASQKDNPEVVEAVEYCMQNDIRVVATTRLQVANLDREISSSQLHKSNIAKKNQPKP